MDPWSCEKDRAWPEFNRVRPKLGRHRPDNRVRPDKRPMLGPNVAHLVCRGPSCSAQTWTPESGRAQPKSGSPVRPNLNQSGPNLTEPNLDRFDMFGGPTLTSIGLHLPREIARDLRSETLTDLRVACVCIGPRVPFFRSRQVPSAVALMLTIWRPPVLIYCHAARWLGNRTEESDCTTRTSDIIDTADMRGGNGPSKDNADVAEVALARGLPTAAAPRLLESQLASTGMAADRQTFCPSDRPPKRSAIQPTDRVVVRPASGLDVFSHGARPGKTKTASSLLALYCAPRPTRTIAIRPAGGGRVESCSDHSLRPSARPTVQPTDRPTAREADVAAAWR